MSYTARLAVRSTVEVADNTSFPVNKNSKLQSIVVRLAGDSGDGIQLMGSQFAVSTALSGRDFATFPDYPAEIRAPAGTTFGVSAYQINLGGDPITTAGDAPDVLVAFNPAALKVSLPLLRPGALIVLNNDSFTPRNLAKAGYADDPRAGNALDQYQVVLADIGHLNLEAVRSFGLSKSEGGRCKNFWALGLLLWMFDRELEPVEGWIRRRLAGKPAMRDANIAALHAGHAFGETAELSASLPQLSVDPARMAPGEYRSVTGAEALALGIAAAGELADREVLYCSYPITPASTSGSSMTTRTASSQPESLNIGVTSSGLCRSTPSMKGSFRSSWVSW